MPTFVRDRRKKLFFGIQLKTKIIGIRDQTLWNTDLFRLPFGLEYLNFIWLALVITFLIIFTRRQFFKQFWLRYFRYFNLISLRSGVFPHFCRFFRLYLLVNLLKTEIDVHKCLFATFLAILFYCYVLFSIHLILILFALVARLRLLSLQSNIDHPSSSFLDPLGCSSFQRSAIFPRDIAEFLEVKLIWTLGSRLLFLILLHVFSVSIHIFDYICKKPDRFL